MQQPSASSGHRQPAARHGRRLRILTLHLAAVLAASATIGHLPAAHGEDTLAPDALASDPFALDTFEDVPDVSPEPHATAEQAGTVAPVPEVRVLDAHAEVTRTDPDADTGDGPEGPPAAIPDSWGGDAVTPGQPAAGGSTAPAGGSQVTAVAADGDPAAGRRDVHDARAPDVQLDSPARAAEPVPERRGRGDPDRTAADAAWTNPGLPADPGIDPDPGTDPDPPAIPTAPRFARLPLLLVVAGPAPASLTLRSAQLVPAPATGTGAGLDLLDPGLDPGENFVTARDAVSRAFDASVPNGGHVERWAAAAEMLARLGSLEQATDFADIAGRIAEHLEREAEGARQLAEFATAYANTLSVRRHTAASQAQADAAAARDQASKMREIAWRATGSATRAADAVAATGAGQRHQAAEPQPVPRPDP
ncbi:MAG TPA: hypothetical protein VKG45_05380 [Actinomycetes bacterium]|nr:hypothetical protein [Actinomycetes bacterium]